MFDFSQHVSSLIQDIVKKVPIFSHIRPTKLLISCADVKKRGKTGTWAQLYPMKYENGHYSIRERSGNRVYLFKTNQIRIGRREIFYIIYLMMPRFQNLSYFQKLETIFHELYHISPEFDGRLRRLHKRYIFHGPSNKLYDERIRYWVRYYLKSRPSQLRNQFLHQRFNELKLKHNGIDMVYIPEPRETIKIMVSRQKARTKKKSKKRRKGRGRG